MIWNPWKRIKELEQDVANLGVCLDAAYGDVESMLGTLEQIAMVAGPRSNVTVRRMSNMAQEAVDKLYGYEADEE
jgi:hypothetical protein